MDGAKLFSAVSCARARSSEHKLEDRSFLVNLKGKFLILRVAEH